MAGLWFLVALILFVAWHRARERSAENYQRGWRDGRAWVKEKIDALDAVTRENVEAIFGFGNQESVTESKPDSAEGQTDFDATNIFASNTQVSEVEVPVAQPAEVDVSEVQTWTEEEIRADKERRTLQNLNALLYVGSFLIVAAMAVFVTLTMPAVVKLASLVLVTAVFYVTGLVLYAKSSRLKPAGRAFVGTGLAILPFFGFALTSLGEVSGPLAWFATSIVGLVAYGVAAVLLQSQLVSYLTMAFVLSFSLSSVSTLGLGMIWYFIVLIGVSLVLNSIYYLIPHRMPSLFAQPIEQTAKIATPVTLLASLTVAQDTDLYMYEVLFGLSTVHYIVARLESRLSIYEAVTRVLAHITALLIASDMAQHISGQDGMLLLNIVWLGLAALQGAYSLLRVRPDNPQSLRRESIYIATMLGLMIVQLPAWFAVAHSGEWQAASLAVIGTVAVATWKRLRQPTWLYVALAVSIALPFVIGREIISPPLGSGIFAIVFTMFGALALVGLDYIKRLGKSQRMAMLMIAASVAYIALVVVCGLVSGDMVTIGWSLLATTILMLALSYSVQSIETEVVAAALGIWSIWTWVQWFAIAPEWKVLTTVLASSVVMAIGATVHQLLKQTQRRTVLATIGASVFAGLVLVVTDGDTVVVRTAVILLLAAAVSAVWCRVVLLKRHATIIGMVALGMYAVYPLLALYLTSMLSDGWTAAAWLIYAVIIWASSYIEKQPGLLGVGNFLFVAGLVPLWSALRFDSGWMVFGTTWSAAAIYYLMYWYTYGRKDMNRMMVSLVSTVLVLGFSAIYYYSVLPSIQQWVVVSAISLIAGSAVLGVHGYLQRIRVLIETSLYIATFGLQRLVWVLFPDLNLVFYAHWWAIVIMLVAVWRKVYHTRAIVALAFVTAATGWYALTGDQAYSLLFLIEHLAVAITGAALRKQWAMWWGIVAVIIAVLYFLRNYTTLMLLFLGLVLITFVIWRLLKAGKSR